MKKGVNGTRTCAKPVFAARLIGLKASDPCLSRISCIVTRSLQFVPDPVPTIGGGAPGAGVDEPCEGLAPPVALCCIMLSRALIPCWPVILMCVLLM